MATTHGEKTLAVEWMAMVVLLTGDALGQSSAGKVKLPQPSRYFASMVVFLMLAGLAAAGERTAKLAANLGAVALLAMALAPPDTSKPVGAGNRPLVLRFLAYLSAIMKSGPAKPTGSIIATGGAGTTGGLPGGAGEASIALQQAIADMNTACALSPTGAACQQAKQRVANIQSVAQGARS